MPTIVGALHAITFGAKGLYLYRRYRDFTMVPRRQFIANLDICAALAPKNGCIVECGVWRGGMSAAIADVLPGRLHFLFDSFQGLPAADPSLDGTAATDFQHKKDHPLFHDNNTAPRSYAEKAMSMSSAREYRLVEGWFSDTLPQFTPPEPIAILRLDGDWYGSTMQCLTALYSHILPRGLVIVDDYYAWDGCCRAVHDYFSAHKATERIHEDSGVAYFRKRARSVESSPSVVQFQNK